ncbi:urease accessory UreF family protein [Nocardioides endophyticus]|uniref:Urease accessory UreF family protein n=1 Tax=Nocardioides endophyticus TaxID=1353775 RepID=A0ABP8Z3W7_9ACTN
MPHPELLLMLLADARLPVAGHTQSAQLEPAVAQGLAARDVPGYLRARLQTVARVEASTAVVARHHLVRGLATAPVEAAWAARTPSAAMRTTSRTQARAFLRLAHRLWPGDAALAALAGIEHPSRSVAIAAAGAAAGLDAVSLARLVGYDDVQTVCAAALKLMPLDPYDVTSWAHSALPAVEELARMVAPLTAPDEIPATGAPQIEAWAEDHAATTRRLFSA